MGNEQSQVSGSNSFGFQVLKNTNDSIQLEPWFDFICGINGRLIDDGHSGLFRQEVQNCAGSAVTLSVWSAKGQRIREVVIPIAPNQNTLGITLRWNTLAVTDDVWHILDVAPGSPADVSGLLPYNDYIIGTPSGIVRGESGLGELVEDHIDRPLVLYVWNAEFDCTREVTIVPRRHWGGEGALGAVLGYGAIHKLPPPFTEPLGEAMFEAPPEDGTVYDGVDPQQQQQQQQQQQLPQDGQQQMPPPPPSAIPFSNPRFQPVPTGVPPPPSSSSTHGHGTARSGKHKQRHYPQGTASFSNAMDAYMQEEESKSREQDYRIADNAATGSLPPPPGKPGGHHSGSGTPASEARASPSYGAPPTGASGIPPPPMRSTNMSPQAADATKGD